MSESLSPRDHVMIAQYQGSHLIVPTSYTGFNVWRYAQMGLTLCPDARKILWNDLVRPIEVSGEGVIVKL